MKKIIAFILSVMMIFVLCACGAQQDTSSEANSTIKAGLVCIGDENDQGYTYNFIEASKQAKEILAKEGINVDWIYIYNKVEGDPVEEANNELVDEGCSIIFNNSYGQEPAMLKVAASNPDVHFVGCTNEGSWKDGLSNTSNAFARIHEGRYLAGIVAGLKLQEMISQGIIKPEEAIIGYVGAYPFAEVVSGYTAYYLGAKSVCPSATMLVQYVFDWSDANGEANAAEALIDKKAVLISQHSDNTTPATAAERHGVFHTGYNANMISAAPQASLVSVRINWTNYFVYALRCIANGEEILQDYSNGLAEGDVELLPMNEELIADGTKEKVENTTKAIIDGSLHIFDINTFTVDGKRVESCFALDTDGDFVADSGEAITQGYFHESDVNNGFQSAPYFCLRIDGITELNAE